jgi:endonuclease/exonuclease/phosphatase family metal-dependent hydrolase
VNHVEGHIAALVERTPDLVALQEVSGGMVEPLRHGLSRAGFGYVVENADRAARAGRPNSLLIGSSWPLRPLPASAAPYPERTLSVAIDSPWGRIDLHCAHIPTGVGHGWTKIETLEAIYAHLARPASHPRILCGDFNTPQLESPDGQVVTFAQRQGPDGRVRTQSFIRDRSGRCDAGARWDRAERAVLTGLAAFDLPDVYRALHSYGVADYSWYWAPNTRPIGRRFDHIFASRSLRPRTCIYLHALRTSGLSDHAAIEAVFFPVSLPDDTSRPGPVA